MSKKIAFVTGGSGFVGRRLLEILVENKWHVRALARSPESAEKIKALGAELVSGDLDVPASFSKDLQGADAVFHCAAQLSFWGPWLGFEQANKTAVVALAEAARSAKVPTFIHVSAASVVMKEDVPMMDVSEEAELTELRWMPYSSSKALGERALLALNAQNFRTVVVRPPFIWGPGDSFDKEIGEQIRSGQFAWIGGADFPYSVCHVDNVCHALLLAAERGIGGRVYFVRDAEITTAREFMSARIEAMGVTPPTRSVPLKLAYVFARFLEIIWTLLRFKSDPPITREMVRLMGRPFVTNMARIQGELGFKPRITRSQGFDALRSRRQEKL